MKLRHLLLASFAACTFASCSDDSSNGIEIPEENYQMIDANVSLTATALDGIQTKGATKEGGDAVLAYIIHSGFISGYQNRYGDNLKPPTNVYHRMTA